MAGVRRTLAECGALITGWSNPNRLLFFYLKNLIVKATESTRVPACGCVFDVVPQGFSKGAVSSRHGSVVQCNRVFSEPGVEGRMPTFSLRKQRAPLNALPGTVCRLHTYSHLH